MTAFRDAKKRSLSQLGLVLLHAVLVLVTWTQAGPVAHVAEALLVTSIFLRASDVLRSPAGAPAGKQPEKRAAPRPRPPWAKAPMRADAEEFVPLEQKLDPSKYKFLLTDANPNLWRGRVADDVSIWTKDADARVPLPPKRRWKTGPRTPPPVDVRKAECALALLRRLRDLSPPKGALPHWKPAGGRVVTGLKQCMKAVARGQALAVLQATDLDHFADPKLAALRAQAAAAGVPLLTALTQAELGQTIAPDLTASVVVVLDAADAEAELALVARVAADLPALPSALAEAELAQAEAELAQAEAELAAF